MINITSVRAISKRLVLAFVGLGLATACEAALITPPGVPLPGTDGGPMGEDPRGYFEANVQPLLESRCRNCHELEEPIFLVPGSYYDSVRTYSPSLFVPGEPESSLVLTYPGLATHTGMDWASEDEREIVREWIRLEGMYGQDLDGGMSDPLVTAPVHITPSGPNSIGLESVGLPGCRVEFLATDGASGPRVSEIIFYAGGSGLGVSGARFVLVDETSGEETFTSTEFTEGNVRVPAGLSMSVTSTPVLSGYTSETMVAIRFDSAGPL